MPANLSRDSAFTPAELLGVAAVTTIMGVLGYSAFRTYTVRAQVAAGLEAARAVATGISQAFERTREIPPDDLSTTLLPPGHAVVESFALERGRIDLLYGGSADAAIAGRGLSLTPYETATLEVIWICGNDVPGPGLKPLGFAGGGLQAEQRAATIEPRYLPEECR